jgi:hypothetical protein
MQKRRRTFEVRHVAVFHLLDAVQPVEGRLKVD